MVNETNYQLNMAGPSKYYLSPYPPIRNDDGNQANVLGQSHHSENGLNDTVSSYNSSNRSPEMLHPAPELGNTSFRSYHSTGHRMEPYRRPNPPGNAMHGGSYMNNHPSPISGHGMNRAEDFNIYPHAYAYAAYPGNKMHGSFMSQPIPTHSNVTNISLGFGIFSGPAANNSTSGAHSFPSHSPPAPEIVASEFQGVHNTSGTMISFSHASAPSQGNNGFAPTMPIWHPAPEQGVAPNTFGPLRARAGAPTVADREARDQLDPRRRVLREEKKRRTIERKKEINDVWNALSKKEQQRILSKEKKLGKAKKAALEEKAVAEMVQGAPALPGIARAFSAPPPAQQAYALDKPLVPNSGAPQLLEDDLGPDEAAVIHDQNIEYGRMVDGLGFFQQAMFPDDKNEDRDIIDPWAPVAEESELDWRDLGDVGDNIPYKPIAGQLYHSEELKVPSLSSSISTAGSFEQFGDAERMRSDSPGT
ncbi:uncharacterized protein RAG0_08550 [Rhynchosporium agropyri]|uniref:Uncharacterized protein n=1 Tax=Rhynchosporium agropyri TaxID=914238 RepID=A0A1E1KRA0_9HELO|nr:uncharacterized protein RAG0_08550 [Rhynchosporium agropyri]